MKYRLAPKPGIIKVNRSVVISGLPLTPTRNGVISLKPSVASTLTLKHPRAALSSPRAQAPAPVRAPTPIKPASVIKPTIQIDKNNQKTFKRTHNKHSIDVGNRVNSTLKDQHQDVLRKHIDKIKALKDSGIGRILVMVACGPSVLQADLSKLKDIDNIDIMCINKPDKRVWPSKYWVFCDYSQYKRNQELWDGYRGTVINSSAVRARHPNQVLIKNLGSKGFSRDMLRGYHIGRSSTYANMQLALWLNYDFVYILGLDMCAVDGVVWNYGQNPDVTSENRIKRFAIEAEHYLYAANEMDNAERSKFIICSTYNPWPFVEKFKRLDQKTAVDHILTMASKK